MLRCNIPEGPEVKISADLIKPLVINKLIVSGFQADTGRYANSTIEGHHFLIESIKKQPTYIESVNTKGKFMYWSFSSGIYMYSTFGMTGQWNLNPTKHACFGFYFEDNSQIHFNDPRHFGTIKFVNSVEVLKNKLNGLGWDPLQYPDLPSSSDFDGFYLKFQKKTNKTLAELLLDQSLFAGCGNYLKSDVCWESRIDPTRYKSTISKDELRLICSNLVKLMHESYIGQGATIATYKTPEGNKGNYQFRAYKKTMDVEGNPIIKIISPDKRSTFLSKNIQK